MAVKTEQLSAIWKQSLDNISAQFTDRTVFNSFFCTSTLYSLDDGIAVIIANSALSKRLLSEDYSDIISAAIHKVTQSEYIVKVVTEADMKQSGPAPIPNPVNKKFFTNSFLKPEFTFDNFVVGKSNSEAFQAAVYVTDHQGTLNPLFIYSKSGLGKTHLLFSIGNAIKNKNPTSKVLYITSEDFIDEYVKWTQGETDRGSMKDFFASIDFLLIDDIQFLAGKEKTSEMFFNIFNLLVNQKKQIVITSDRSPDQLEGLQDRLVSRFSQGLTVSIEKPEKKTLIEILKMKIKSNGIDPSLFDEDAVEYIADNNSKNIRLLEGALNRILFFNISAGNTKRITLELVKQAFADDADRNNKPKELTVESIVQEVAKYYSLTEAQIMSKVRTSQIALARAIAMYLSRNMLNLSYAQVGKAFDGKDHTTVLSACSKVENMLKTDEGMKKAYQNISKNLK